MGAAWASSWENDLIGLGWSNGHRPLGQTRLAHQSPFQQLFSQRPKTRLEPSRVVLYPFAQHSVRHGDPLEHHGGRYDALPLACGHRLRSLGTRRPRSGLRLCGRMMHICDHRYRHFHTLEGPVELVCKLNHCPDPDCPGHAKTKSPELEATIALPAWAIGWDVFCWIGHRRCSRHWSIPQIRSELLRRLRDQALRALPSLSTSDVTRPCSPRGSKTPRPCADNTKAVDDIILSIDGLQPEKGHETLYVVRELTQKRVWFAEPLLSATAARGSTLDRSSQGVGRDSGQARGPVDVGQAGRLRHGDRGGVSRGAAPLLRQPLPPRCWPSPFWRPTATPRFRCGRRCVACGRSNGPC